MTHFNHEWDTTQTPAVPVATGDRYYAQDLNDDFNYLKHLPYEILLQGRSRGVMILPEDTWDNDNNQLTLSGGFGVILQDHICLDPDEDWSVPPKTKISPRYERIPFTDVTLILPNDGNTHYIVATPTKRSLLQRTKALLTSQYASRTKYDGVVTIQDTAPTAGQILVGLCHNKEYCLLIDNNPDQCKDNIILKKWFGQNKITTGFVSILQSYYNTLVASVETKISIITMTDGIYNGSFSHCVVSIDTVSSTDGIYGGTFNDCTITIGTVSGSNNNYSAIGSGTFNNCTITIGTVISRGISGGTFNNCTIVIDTVTSSFETAQSGNGVRYGVFNNCNISINTVSNSGFGFYGGAFRNCTMHIGAIPNANGAVGGTFTNCAIVIDTVGAAGYAGTGISGGIFHNCTVTISTVATNSHGVRNSGVVYLYLTHIICTATTDLSSTHGKLNVLNDTVLHTS